MDIYEYVADADPQGSKALIQSYGFRTFGGITLDQVNDPADIAEGLKQLVTSKGVNALNDIADIHPDKELLYSRFQQENATNNTASNPPVKKSGCGCGCGGAGKSDAEHHSTIMPANPNNGSGFYINQTQALVGVGIVLVLIAIAKN